MIRNEFNLIPEVVNMKYAMRLSLAVLLVVASGGCANWRFWERSVPVEFKIGESKPADGLSEQTVAGSDQTVYLHPKAALTNADIASATVKPASEGFGVEVVFTEEGRKAFANLTKNNVEKHLAIIVDGEIVSAPIIKSPIATGAALITGDFSEEEANRIAEGIMRK
jgi:preprotein translocase subunit SecD